MNVSMVGLLTDCGNYRVVNSHEANKLKFVSRCYVVGGDSMMVDH